MTTEAAVKEHAISALVVEGGAMRGIFSTGVLDAFLDNNFKPFDIYIGVSAGATNLASFLAEMPKRNYKVYTDYSIRPEFISWRKFIFGGHLVDLDWLWDITIKELRLDIPKVMNMKQQYLIGATEASTGKAVFMKPDEVNFEDLLKASSALPVLYRKFISIEDVDYVDGGLADPIPVREAYNRGAKNIMVIRSRPYGYTMKSSSNSLFNNLYLKKYPMLLAAINNRPTVYQESIEFMRNPPEGVNIIEVNPSEDFQTKRLTKDLNILKQDYKLGYDTGIEVMNRWKAMQE